MKKIGRADAQVTAAPLGDLRTALTLPTPEGETFTHRLDRKLTAAWVLFLVALILLAGASR